MRFALLAMALGAAVPLGGCGSLGFPGVYRIDVEQGNVVTQKMVDKLKPGMTRSQVRFILGTPLLEDSFNQSRWDYVYALRHGSSTRALKRLSVFFDGDTLSHFEGDFAPFEERI